MYQDTKEKGKRRKKGGKKKYFLEIGDLSSSPFYKGLYTSLYN